MDMTWDLTWDLTWELTSKLTWRVNSGDIAFPFATELGSVFYARRVRKVVIIKTMKSPKTTVLLQVVVSFVVIALALFFAAGTIGYWQAWVYLAVGAVTSIPLVRYITNDPVLRENRTRLGPTAEQRPIQKIIVLMTGIPAIAAFIIPALDHRFGWSSVPYWLVITGNLSIFVSMWMVYRVFKENSFGSATIEVRKGQKVISTGPYAIVRNPMYSSAALYFIGMSLALGSYWGLIASTLTLLGLVWRLFDEEKFLAQNLPGYSEYCAKVRWHLIPGIF
jgi:protein-S-isoprenylcysteine O-methyltransferase Ste14